MALRKENTTSPSALRRGLKVDCLTASERVVGTGAWV